MKKIIFKTILLSIVFLLLSASNTQVLSISTKTQNDYDFTPVDDLLKGTVDTMLRVKRHGVSVFLGFSLYRYMSFWAGDYFSFF